MGAVLAAVSPAVVVPRMVKLMEEKRGTEKSIPQMILAGASCDDIFVITLFSAFAAMAQGESADISGMLNVPVSIIIGVLGGAVCGYLLYLLFDISRKKGQDMGNTVKLIVLLSVAFVLMYTETALKGYAAFSGLLAVTAMACAVKLRTDESVWGRLGASYGQLWMAAEVLLFVLVGAAVDIRYTLAAGIPSVIMIFAALIFRSAGVLVCLAGTKLTAKERLFCVIAYLPKATVQAAMGSVPLAMGLPCGNIVLSVSVLGIIITAPLGAIGIDCTYKKLLEDNG